MHDACLRFAAVADGHHALAKPRGAGAQLTAAARSGAIFVTTCATGRLQIGVEVAHAALLALLGAPAVGVVPRHALALDEAADPTGLADVAVGAVPLAGRGALLRRVIPAAQAHDAALALALGSDVAAPARRRFAAAITAHEKASAEQADDDDAPTPCAPRTCPGVRHGQNLSWSEAVAPWASSCSVKRRSPA